MPRFVVLEHDYPFLHWDLMLEVGDVLRTWRLARPPAAPETDLPATALSDHRTQYLDYEGPVSGNRGSVLRWDHGSYEILGDVYEFHGSKLTGHWRMQQHVGNACQFLRS